MQSLVHSVVHSEQAQSAKQYLFFKANVPEIRIMAGSPHPERFHRRVEAHVFHRLFVDLQHHQVKG